MDQATPPADTAPRPGPGDPPLPGGAAGSADPAGALDGADAGDPVPGEEDDESLPVPQLDLRSLIMSDSARETRRFGRIPALVAEATVLVWRAGRWRGVLVAALQALAGLGLGAQLLAGNQILAQALQLRSSGGDLAGLVPAAVTFVAIAGALAVAGAVATSQQGILSELVSTYANGQIMTAAAAAELTDFEDPDFYNQLQRATVGGQFRPFMMVSGVLSLVSGLLSTVGVGLALFAVSPVLLPLAALAAVPPLVAILRNAKGEYIRIVSNTADDRERGYLREALTERDPAKEVRSFNLLDYLRRRHDAASERVIRRTTVEARARLRRTLLGAAGGGLASAVAGGVLLALLVSGRLAVAAAATAAVGMQQVRARITASSFSIGAIFESGLYLEDFHSFLTRSARRPPGGSTPVGPFSELATHRAGFSYPGSERPALRDVDMVLRAGEVVALVGENGSGKTTLAKLLCGLYRPTDGSVTWDGLDVRDVDLQSMRDHITVIFQDFVHYALPARDNVGLGRHERIEDDEGIRRATRLAGLERVFDRLPEGWATILGPQFGGGQDLSGGQWQRVALARAFFRDAAFLVMDEPTAALDARAEHRLFQRLRELSAGKAVLLITHRFGNVRMADRIYVLHLGRVVEHGTHDELMALDGRYAELFRLQAEQFQPTAPTGATS